MSVNRSDTQLLNGSSVRVLDQITDSQVLRILFGGGRGLSCAADYLFRSQLTVF